VAGKKEEYITKSELYTIYIFCKEMGIKYLDFKQKIEDRGEWLHEY